MKCVMNSTCFCSWQFMEVAAGKVKSKAVHLKHGTADVVQWTLATAAANKLNVLRSFGHGVDSSFPLQTKAGQLQCRRCGMLIYSEKLCVITLCYLM